MPTVVCNDSMEELGALAVGYQNQQGRSAFTALSGLIRATSLSTLVGGSCGSDLT